MNDQTTKAKRQAAEPKLAGFSDTDVHVVGGKPAITLGRALLALACLAGVAGVGGYVSGSRPSVLVATVHDHTGPAATPPISVVVSRRIAAPAQARNNIPAEPDGDDAFMRSVSAAIGAGTGDPAGAAPRSVPSGVRAAPSARAPAPVTPDPGDCGARADAEMADDGSTVFGQASRPCAPDARRQFAAPDGRRTGPRSSLGVRYTMQPILDEQRLPDGETSIIQGGVTDRTQFGLKKIQGIGDPSDAFMVIAAKTVMANAATSYDAAAAALESVAMQARACTATFGLDHSCSVSGAGITFDFGRQQFTARLDGGAAAGARAGTRVVAVETANGLVEGPAFAKVVQARHEAGPAVDGSGAPAPR